MKNKNIDPVLQFMLPYVKKKQVLDIGCVEHTLKNRNKDRLWVHDFLVQNAKSVVGIDILEKDVARLKKEGYNVEVQSAENFEFDRKFDVIVAGELIEHIGNLGGLLTHAHKHLKPKGVLIITTSNGFNLLRLVVSLLRLSNDPPVNDEHTVWFSPKVMNTLLTRYGFKITKIGYADYPSFKPRFHARVFNALSKPIPRMKETMMLICVKK